jgi:restriction endonuclease S subunit
VEADLVEGIVAMPPQLFYTTQIPVSLWFLNKNKKQKGKTLFIDARSLGTMVSRKLRELTDEDIAKIADTFTAFESGTCEEIKGFCAVAETADIAKHDYILTPGRYVGIEETEDDGEPFDEKMIRLTGELAEMFAKRQELEQEIRKRLGRLGMSSNGWKEVKMGDVISFNPRESIGKKQMAKKIAMENLKPFTKFIDQYELAPFNGGAKFRNGDTLLARITPCLENGKTSQVTILDNDEIGFGSTEFIVFRAEAGITDKDYIYYLSISPSLREIAIKSMIGSSGRQRVQQRVLKDINLSLPPLSEQKAIAATLSCLDDLIELNNRTTRFWRK